MKIPFKQGIITAPNNFLVRAGNNININIPGGEQILFTVSDGDTDYVVSEPSTVVGALKGPFVAGLDYWLYWDIHTTSAKKSYGVTTLKPIVAPAAPSEPQHDQHWFDTLRNVMFVFDARFNRWQRHIRVFMAYTNGVDFTGMAPRTMPNDTGFVGPQTSAMFNGGAAGFIIFDAKGSALRKGDGTFFTSEDIASTSLALGARVKLESSFMPARAVTAIPAYSLVRYASYGEIAPANSLIAGRGAYGVIDVDAAAGDEVNVIHSGVVINPSWNWDVAGATVNDYVYVDHTGNITLTPPADAANLPVGIIIERNAIVLINTDRSVTTNSEGGTAGATGFTGSQGVTGFTGSGGTAGANGATGFTGSQGVTGYTGSGGTAGANGATGFTGSQGVTGYTGSAGVVTQQQIIDVAHTIVASTFSDGAFQDNILLGEMYRFLGDNQQGIYTHLNSAQNILTISAVDASSTQKGVASFDPSSFTVTDGMVTLTSGNIGILSTNEGGTGAAALTGYIVGNGTNPMTAVASIPGGDVSGDIAGNAGNVNGVVSVANGGTGAVDAATACANLGAASAAHAHAEYAAISHAHPEYIPPTELPSKSVVDVITVPGDITAEFGHRGAYVRMISATANSFTVAADANTTPVIPINSIITIRQAGAGVTTIVAAPGVTINSVGTLSLRAQHSSVQLLKVGADEWDIIGDVML